MKILVIAGFAPARASVTVRSSRAASVASLASAVPGTDARTWSHRRVEGSDANFCGTFAGST